MKPGVGRMVSKNIDNTEKCLYRLIACFVKVDTFRRILVISRKSQGGIWLGYNELGNSVFLSNFFWDYFSHTVYGGGRAWAWSLDFYKDCVLGQSSPNFPALRNSGKREGDWSAWVVGAHAQLHLHEWQEHTHTAHASGDAGMHTHLPTTSKARFRMTQGPVLGTPFLECTPLSQDCRLCAWIYFSVPCIFKIFI